MQDIISQLKKQIEAFEPTVHAEDIGVVTVLGDGIAEISGLSGVMMSEMLLFDTTGGRSLKEIFGSHDGVLGIAQNLEEDSVKAVILGDTSLLKEGMVVRSTGKILSIPVSHNFVGRVIDALGNPLDGGSPIEATESYPIENKAYGIIERKSVNTPLHTGTKAIDAMIPIGRGQRELIIGDRQTGKSVLAIDMILNQQNEPIERRPICIYVAIGQKESKIAKLVHELKEKGAMSYTIIVSASAGVPAPLQFLAPFSGTAIGEYFMNQGKDAVIIYDDLSKHAVAYRQMSLLLRRPPGREAYPGDIFYLHSRLLERAAKLSDAMGGGSLTALPIIETQEGDVSAYIPTNVISITDGQIYLEPELFNRGVKPAVNVGLSVSRVGSAAQTKAMKKVAGKLRLELAQFRELEAFVQFSQDVDDETKKRIERGKLMVEVLKQDKHTPLSFEKQVVLLFAAVSGLFAGIPTEKVRGAGESFLDYCENHKKKVLDGIKSSRELSEEAESSIKGAGEEWKQINPLLFEYVAQNSKK